MKHIVHTNADGILNLIGRKGTSHDTLQII